MAVITEDHGGFVFAGHEASEFQLEYVPDTTQMYAWKAGIHDTHEETFAAHDGGYYYGETMKPKDFVLRCIFERSDVRDGVLSKIDSFFRRGKIGRLIFDKRPWVYYMARVIRTEFQMTNFLNGFVTIYMRAHYPFGRYDALYADSTHEYYSDILCNSSLLDQASLPNINPISLDATITQDEHLLLYNGGTEYAPVAVEIAGNVGEGFDIRNETTGETMGFVAINEAVTKNAGKCVICDSLNGKTILTDGTNSQLAFLYHDTGFLHLKPGTPVRRNLRVTINGTTVTHTDDTIGGDQIGQYMCVDGQQRKIIAVGENTITLKNAFNNIASGSVKNAHIATFNEITISPRSEATISWLKFDYTPTFA